MIGSVSNNYTSYTSTSTSSTSANAARRAQLQKELFTRLDSNGDGSVSQDELKPRSRTSLTIACWRT